MMQALQLVPTSENDPENKKFEINTVPIPEIEQPNQVLVKVAYAGICTNDVHLLMGEWKCKNTAFTMGHECVGYVHEIGDEVTTLQVGDHVVVHPLNNCYVCKECLSGRPQFCDQGDKKYMGVYSDGSWADYLLTRDLDCFKLSDNFKIEQGIFMEPVACTLHVFSEMEAIELTERILILGAGLLGKIWASILHFRGYRNVTVSEPNFLRIEMFKKLDLGYEIIDPYNLKKRAILDCGYLFDLVIDCSGFPKATQQGLNLLDVGGRLCIVGSTTRGYKTRINPSRLTTHQLRIYGFHSFFFSFLDAFLLITKLGERYLNYETMGAMTFSIDDYKDAFYELKNGRTTKAIFRFD